MSEPAPLPDLPERVEPDALRDMADADLDAVLTAVREVERATIAAMSPYSRQLKELQARAAEVATEQRRRERAAHIAQRKAVREQAAAGEMPTLEAALAAPDLAVAPDETPLAALRAFLATGGEVGFGFASRPGTLAFTDGRRQQPATTWGEARRLYADGWEPGAPGVPGVRIHLAGTRVERVVPLDGVVVERHSAATG